MQTRMSRDGGARSAAPQILIACNRHLSKRMLMLLAGVLLAISSNGGQAQSIDGTFQTDAIVLQSRSLLTGAVVSPVFTPQRGEVIAQISGTGPISYEERRWHTDPLHFPLALNLATSRSWTDIAVENDHAKTTAAIHLQLALDLYGDRSAGTAAFDAFQVTVMPRSVLTASMPASLSLEANLPTGTTFNMTGQLILSLDSGGDNWWDELRLATDSEAHIEQTRLLSVSWLNPTDEPVNVALHASRSISASGRLPPLPPPVPEPSGLLLLLAGLAVLARARPGRRSYRTSAAPPTSHCGRHRLRSISPVLLALTVCAAKAQSVDVSALLMPPSAHFTTPADGRSVTLQGEWQSIETSMGYCGLSAPCTLATDIYDPDIYTPHTQYRRFGTEWAQNVLPAPAEAWTAATHLELDDAPKGEHALWQYIDAGLRFQLPTSVPTFTVPFTIDVVPAAIDGRQYSTAVYVQFNYFNGALGVGHSEDHFVYSGDGPARFDRSLTLVDPYGGDISLQVGVYFSTVQVYNPIPEPAQFAMLAAGLLALTARRCVRFHRSPASRVATRDGSSRAGR